MAYGNSVTVGIQQINPLDKIGELYDRLLKAEQEKVALLLRSQLGDRHS